MSDAHIRANEVKTPIEPVRQPGRELIRLQEQGPVQAVVPQAAYRRVQLNRNGLRPADLLALQRTVGNRGVQRMVIAAAPGARLVPAPPVTQFDGHKPKDGQTIRYPATGPKDGDLYTVVEALDNGSLRVTKNVGGKTSNLNWQTDSIWLVYDPDPKDVDMRYKASEWAALTAEKKTIAYEGAKAQALKLLLASADGGMVNATTKAKLKKEVTLGQFVQQRAGEWQFTWNEINGRQWQFTIDMDKPLAESWQEPHVGWEVKLITAGANHAQKPYGAFAKQQGHVWMNDVPEFRQ